MFSFSQESMLNVFDCMLTVIEQRDLRLDFNSALQGVSAERTDNVKSKVTMKKLNTMTPLQIVCSFQTWNAKPITELLHDKLEEVVRFFYKLAVV